jgi:hypothetical protein
MKRATLLAIVLSCAAGVVTAAENVIVSKAGGERSLSLTVYTVGRALVRDARTVAVPSGHVALEFRDIAASVMPETVAVTGDGLDVLEQNYEYDLLSPHTLLAKYLGRDVTLVMDEPGAQPGEVVRTRVTGRLLSINDGTVWRIGDSVVTNPPYRTLMFSDVPETLRDQPTLVWLLDIKGAGQRRVEATYLTTGISWQADYVLTLDTNGQQGDLLAWVTLDNNSGAAYPDARLQLVAGEVHLAPQPTPRRVFAEQMMAKAAPQVSEETLAEYHLYTLERPTTIKDRQKKQVTLLEANDVQVVKRYRIESPTYWFQSKIGKQKQDVRVDVELANRAANHLGMPLPAGVVRLYQKDARGTAQFIGEDRIEHTPRDETVTLTMGNAFDIVAERRQTDFRSFDHTTESAFEVVIRNHKDQPVTVEVREHVGGDWEMLSANQPYDKISAFGIEFKVPVQANGESTLTYRVRVKH